MEESKEEMENRYGYKAFDKGMRCLEKQYSENTLFEEDGNCICQPGVTHYCINPLNVWHYYCPICHDGDIRRDYAEVTAVGKVVEQGDKCATNKLLINSKITLQDLIEAQSDISDGGKRHCQDRLPVIGDNETMAVKGNSNDLVANGNELILASAGRNNKLSCIGRYCNEVTCGFNNKMSFIGGFSNIICDGNKGRAVSIGECNRVTASGCSNVVCSVGSFSEVTIKGSESIGVSFGTDAIASGDIGNWIVLSETCADSKGYKVKCVKAALIDGVNLMPNTRYILKNGKFVAAYINVSEGEE